MQRAQRVTDRSQSTAQRAQIAAINQASDRTPLKPADLLFVFGTREEVLRAESPAGSGATAISHAIVSGGDDAGSGLSECSIIKPAMVAGGVPAERILEEHRATNTGENVIFSLPVIAQALGLANSKA